MLSSVSGGTSVGPGVIRYFFTIMHLFYGFNFNINHQTINVIDEIAADKTPGTGRPVPGARSVRR